MTGCERVLAALRSGPKTASELYGLGLIAHSRVAELRSKGHVISCERTGNDGARSYRYSLLSEPEESVDSPRTVEAPSLPPVFSSGSLSVVRRNKPQPNRPVSVQRTDGAQLTVFDALAAA